MIQVKKLNELLDADALDVVENVIEGLVSAAHPGSEINHQFEPDIGKIAIGYKPSEVEARAEIEAKLAVPYKDLCVFLDSSGSISESGGVYDKIAEGAKKSFEAGKDEDGQYAVVNFASETLFSGWAPRKDASQLDTLIDMRQGNDSQLGKRFIEQLLAREEKFASLVVTDGEIYNFSTFTKGFKALSEKGNRIGIIVVSKNPHSHKCAYDSIGDFKSFADMYFVTDVNAVPELMVQYAKFVLGKGAKPTVK